MKNLFDLKRTKMVDEAAFRHKPTTTGKGILTFVLVYIISNLISVIIPSIIDTIYNFRRLKSTGLIDEYYNAVQSGNAEKEAELFEMMFSNVASPWWLIAVELFASIFVAAVAIFFCYKFEKRKITSMGLRKNGAIPECLLGFSIGALITAITIGISFASKSVSFIFDKPFTTFFYLLIPACLISALAEELLMRGYFMTSLARDMKPISAISISALVYTVFYIPSLNPIVIVNAFLFGFLMGLYVFKRGSIWGSTMINFAWTYISCVIFGSPALSCPSILEPSFKHLDFISGGKFGFDSGLAFTLVLVIAIAIILLTKTKKGEISEFEIDYFA